jgi:hypothetical protein
MARDLYVDADSVLDGVGSEVSPFAFSQLRNYFNPDVGTDCIIIPEEGDNISVKGIANDYIDNGKIFDVKRNLDITVNIQAWDLANNGIWLIETESYPAFEDIKLFSNVPGFRISGINMKDFGLLHNNPGTAKIYLMRSALTSWVEEIRMAFKNFMVYSERDIDAGAPEYSTLDMDGFTFKGDVLSLYGLGDLYMADGVIKANQIVDVEVSNIYQETGTDPDQIQEVGDDPDQIQEG